MEKWCPNITAYEAYPPVPNRLIVGHKDGKAHIMPLDEVAPRNRPVDKEVAFRCEAGIQIRIVKNAHLVRACLGGGECSLKPLNQSTPSDS